MPRTEIRIAGFGGQGVMLAGIIIGKAATIHDRKHAVMVQSFGPEARGGTCSSQLILSEDPIRYPYVRKPDILVALSQESYDKFAPKTAEGATLIVEADLVKPGVPEEGRRAFTIPATRIAEDLGRKQVINMIVVGFFTAITRVVTRQAAVKAVLDSVPKGTEKLNLEAFDKGFEHGKKALGESA